MKATEYAQPTTLDDALAGHEAQCAGRTGGSDDPVQTPARSLRARAIGFPGHGVLGISAHDDRVRGPLTD
jgi:hypothetical protein